MEQGRYYTERRVIDHLAQKIGRSHQSDCVALIEPSGYSCLNYINSPSNAKAQLTYQPVNLHESVESSGQQCVLLKINVTNAGLQVILQKAVLDQTHQDFYVAFHTKQWDGAFSSWPSQVHLSEIVLFLHA